MSSTTRRQKRPTDRIDSRLVAYICGGVPVVVVVVRNCPLFTRRGIIQFESNCCFCSDSIVKLSFTKEATVRLLKDQNSTFKKLTNRLMSESKSYSVYDRCPVTGSNVLIIRCSALASS
ncbi:unnamed protein product [Nippostrongylus brasiliensis]|uniref:Ovule protein n=1 Tax=Nippostrongylus brasiliensis TaxID=27835 RepID=A0A0N4YTK2_NIPBR|nr:unnamed protein product [Nippostrongylus brasiliensis]